MSDKKKTKIILAYAAGILVLALCIAAAWFLPEAYGKWQDQRLIGQVQLSNRKEINFLDGDVLDQIVRWQELEACTDFFWESSEAWYFTVSSNWDEFVQACEEETRVWCENGLLPLEEEQLDFLSKPVIFAECRTLLAGENVIPVAILSFSMTDTFFENELESGCITVVLDTETKKAYYISVVGAGVQEYMAQQLGYASSADMKTKLMKTDRQSASDGPDTSGMNFAAVCGADRQAVTSNPGMLELDVDLEYDSFRMTAQRRVIVGEHYLASMGYPSSTMGYGVAVMFGPTNSPDVFMDCLYMESAEQGYWECIDGLIDTEVFCDTVYTEEYYGEIEAW